MYYKLTFILAIFMDFLSGNLILDGFKDRLRLLSKLVIPVDSTIFLYHRNVAIIHGNTFLIQ